MAQVEAHFKNINANSTTLPICGLMAIAGEDLWLREVAIFNDGTTGVLAMLQRVTAAGTPGSTITGTTIDKAAHTVLGTLKGLWTVTPTFGTEIVDMPAGAAVGAGTIMTWWKGNGLFIPAGTANGVVLVQKAAVAQAVSGYFIWDE